MEKCYYAHLKLSGRLVSDKRVLNSAIFTVAITVPELLLLSAVVKEFDCAHLQSEYVKGLDAGKWC